MLNPRWLCVLCACVSGAVGVSVPGWSDLLPALQPYVDPAETADETAFLETPRFGVISLNSGTAFNTTLNLTGHILLGLGLATSLLLYMFINALENKGSQGSSSSYGYGAPATGYGRKKRSIDDVDELASALLRRLDSQLRERGIHGKDCFALLSCLADNNNSSANNAFSVANAINSLFDLVIDGDALPRGGERGVDDLASRHFEAVMAGRSLDHDWGRCHAHFPLCHASRAQLEAMLQQT